MSDELLRVLLEFQSFANGAASLYLFLKILPVRHERVLVAAVIVPDILISMVRYQLRGNPLSVLWLIYAFALPLFFWKAPLSHRILATSANTCLMFGIELIFGVAWISLTGTPNASYDAAYLNQAFSIFGRALFLMLYFPGANLLIRAGSKLRSDELRETSLVPLCALVLVQIAVIEFLFLPGLSVLSAEASYYLVALLALVGCALTDISLFAASRRHFEAQRERSRADALEQNLRACLREEADCVEALRQAARIRHDLRNHLQVLDGLIQRGRADEARDYATRLRELYLSPAREEVRGHDD